MTVRALVLGVLALIACGCGERAARPAEASAPLGDAAAVVDDERVSLDEVRALVASSGMTPRAALERLVSERLLAHYAERRGYGAFPGVAQGVERSEVQALLARAVEADAGVDEAGQRLAALIAELARRTKVQYVDAGMAALFAPPGD